jgi:hypothetical protein
MLSFFMAYVGEDLLCACMLLAALLGMCWGCFFFFWTFAFFYKKLKNALRGQKNGRTLRVVDVCTLAGKRRLVIFTSPFLQGLLLLSPKGDHLIPLPKKTSYDAKE